MLRRFVLSAVLLAASFTAHEASAQWDPNALFPPGSKLAEAETVRKDQALAESLMKELASPFKKALTIDGKPANARVGKTIAIKVLSAGEYKKKESQKANAEYEEDLRALLRHRPEFVRRKLDAADKQDLLSKRYPRVDANTVIAEADKAFVLPRVHRPSDAGAGFYSGSDDTIYVRSGQVGIALIAHEMTHAYASKTWNDVQLQVVAYGLLQEINKLDEAMTSEIADLAIDEWHSAQPRATRGDKPSGYVGYGQPIRLQGAAIVGAVDPRSRLSAYLGGNVSVAMNEKDPTSSKIKLAKKTLVLSELFTR